MGSFFLHVIARRAGGRVEAVRPPYQDERDDTRNSTQVQVSNPQFGEEIASLGLDTPLRGCSILARNDTCISSV